MGNALHAGKAKRPALVQQGNQASLQMRGQRNRVEESTMSATAWLYICSVLGGGLVLSLLAVLDLTASPAIWVTWAILTALATSAQLFKAHFKSNQESSDGQTLYSPVLVFLFAGVVLLPPGLFILLVIVSHVIEWVRERWIHSTLLRHWYIQPFNIANHILAGAAAGFLYHMIQRDPPGELSPTPVMLALIAALVYVLGNHMLVGQVLVLARKIPWRETGVFDPETLLPDFVMLALGYTLALQWHTNPWLILPTLLPLGLIYRALQVPQLKKEAQTDGKTGLLNARRVQELVNAELERARRFERPMTIIMADLDLLRNINNTYGHLAGDTVLAGLGRVIRENVREYDLAGRFGGEEFIIGLPETDLPTALVLAERLRQAVATARHTVATSQEPIRATMSMGVACFPEDGTDLTQLTHAADVAVYQAKLRGRDRVVAASAVPHSINLLAPGRGEVATPEYSAAFAGRVVAVDSARAPADAQAAPGVSVKQETHRDESHPASGSKKARGGQDEQKPLGAAAPARRYSWTFLQLFVGAIIAAGISVLVLGLLGHPRPDLLSIGLLALITVCVEFLQINVYGDNTASGTVATVFAAGLIGGVPGVAVASAAIALTHYVRQRPAPYKTAFNWATHLLAGLAPALLPALIGLPPQAPLLLVVISAAAGAIIFFLVDTGLVACAISLASGSRLVPTWRTQFQWLAGHYLVLGLIGLFIALAYLGQGVAGLLVFTMPILMIRYAQHQYVERTRGSMQELKRMNQELAQANQEIGQANRAIRELNDELFITLSKVLDARDPYVAGHAEQVAKYARTIAEALGLPPGQVEAIRQAGFLHDIGKIAISEQILHKPARLTAEEYEYMKTHAAIGAQLLESSQALRHLAPFVRNHHERWDGQGYPEGLAGEAIPLEARILAVCDAVEAMASDRPYSRGKTVDEIIAEVERCAGTHFDPQVAAVFVQIAAQQRETFIVNSARVVVSRAQDPVERFLGGAWLPAHLTATSFGPRNPAT
jgi:diguanylate cyclase (GGDEF)-like protein/putative nucleotidyltransferase with HDIG domain